MEPRITLITLAVADLERSLAFYRDGLGWPTEGIVGQDIENGAVVFFELQSGLKLALWPRASLAKEARVDVDRHGPASFEVAHNVRSKAEVDEVVALATTAGAKVTNPPADRPWGGYSAHFQDPDGHLWEIAWNPDPRFATE
ncbi:MAG TPA: VOC family protein [Candidatus Limnocylindria bacterium]|nr:VOC family protein [Candidatus Limnocylindria bacterium]